MPAGNERGKMLPWSCQIASRFFKEEVPNLKRGVSTVFTCLVMGTTLDRLESIARGEETTGRKPW